MVILIGQPVGSITSAVHSPWRELWTYSDSDCQKHPLFGRQKDAIAQPALAASKSLRANSGVQYVVKSFNGSAIMLEVPAVYSGNY